MRIGIASDHAGTELKVGLVALLKSMGHEAFDRGPELASPQKSVDYPDFAGLVAQDVSQKSLDLGILICGTGTGMAIAANKYLGVRAAVCYDEFTVRMAKSHNNINILCLGARVTTRYRAEDLVRLWLETPFEAGRHQDRVEKIHRAEQSVGLKKQ
jgi:ribose 5-phosphate isomerase B